MYTTYYTRCEQYARMPLFSPGNELGTLGLVDTFIPTCHSSAGSCSLPRRIEAAHIQLRTSCVPVTGNGLGGKASPLACSYLLFFLSGHPVYPQSLLSFHPQTTCCNKKETSFPPCSGSCISRARPVRFRCTRSIPGVHRECDSVLSSSRHSMSFGT